jgi:PAS domain S-box-containing protein
MRNNQPISQREYQYPDDATLMSTTDAESRITYANDAFIEVSGFASEDIIGQPHNVVRASFGIQRYVGYITTGFPLDSTGEKPPQQWRSLLGSCQRRTDHSWW